MAEDRPISPVKLLFQIIQVLHHLSMSQDGKKTKAFSRKIKELNRFIRPALPHPQVIQQIQEVNNAWAINIAKTLSTHYQDQLNTLKSLIPNYNFSESEWSSIKSKSIQWAKRNFGRKLQTSTLHSFDQTLLDLPIKIQNQPKHSSNTGSSLISEHPRKVKGPEDKLSNFFPLSFRFEGRCYRSLEQAYQYIKCEFFKQTRLAAEVLKQKTAAGAKQVTKGLGVSDRAWMNYKVGLMARLLDTKFNCLEEFRDALRQTGSRRVVHPVPDSFWGRGPDGRGRNMFSQLLMDLRRNKLQPNRNQNRNPTRPTPPPPPPPPAHDDPITKYPVATSTAL